MPGGRVDAGESAEETALRELAEEVGLVLDAGAVLGRLDDYITRSGFAITPVVVWAGEARHLLANPAEVESIHRIAVREFMRSDAPLLDPIADSEHPVLRMPVGTSWIAEQFNISPSTIKYHAAIGYLRGFKEAQTPKLWKFWVEDVLAYIARRNYVLRAS